MYSECCVKQEWEPVLTRLWDLSRVKQITQITNGGSPRSFYRLRNGRESLILLECKTKHEGLDDYITIDTFYADHNVPVPRIYSGSADDGILLMEDLGEESLYSLVLPLLESGKTDEVVELYKKVIDTLINIQKISISSAPQIVSSRMFTYDYYRWETDYFRDKCCGDYFHVNALEDELITKELESIAESLNDCPLVIVHRDFQSQNIFVRDKEVFIVDFQSARLGSKFYDLASLLKDPYVELPIDIQNRLFDYYLTESQKQGICGNISRQKEITIYRKVALQRLMQALGAYGKLGLTNGKVQFLDYIQPALRLVNGTLEEMNEFPYLKSLGEKLLSSMK